MLVVVRTTRRDLDAMRTVRYVWLHDFFLPRGELVFLLHILHNLLERLFLLDIHAVAYLLLVLPIVDHGFDDAETAILGLSMPVFGRAALIWHNVVCWATVVRDGVVAGYR